MLQKDSLTLNFEKPYASETLVSIKVNLRYFYSKNFNIFSKIFIKNLSKLTNFVISVSIIKKINRL